MKKFFKEFGEFIKKGNAFNLAIGIVIGGAFQKIVSSLVNDVIMPIISIIVRVNISEAKWIMKDAVYDIDSNLVSAEIALKYGAFIQTIIDFLIIAFSIFLAIKVASKLTTELNKAKTEIKTIVSKKKKSGKAEVASEVAQVKEIENPEEKK